MRCYIIDSIRKHKKKSRQKEEATTMKVCELIELLSAMDKNLGIRFFDTF
jgi:hypothetical protein